MRQFGWRGQPWRKRILCEGPAIGPDRHAGCPLCSWDYLRAAHCGIRARGDPSRACALRLREAVPGATTHTRRTRMGILDFVKEAGEKLFKLGAAHAATPAAPGLSP